jgi:hypothetical protein
VALAAIAKDGAKWVEDTPVEGDEDGDVLDFLDVPDRGFDPPPPVTATPVRPTVQPDLSGLTREEVRLVQSIPFDQQAEYAASLRRYKVQAEQNRGRK